MMSTIKHQHELGNSRRWDRTIRSREISSMPQSYLDKNDELLHYFFLLPNSLKPHLPQALSKKKFPSKTLHSTHLYLNCSRSIHHLLLRDVFLSTTTITSWWWLPHVHAACFLHKEVLQLQKWKKKILSLSRVRKGVYNVI